MAIRNIYIDSSADPGGDGSLSSPYDTFSDINWTTGGLNSIFDWVAASDDVFINLAGGSNWREQLVIGCSGVSDHPITMQAYGDGDLPTILGSVAKNETSDWTDLGSNKWATANNSFPLAESRSPGFVMLGNESQSNVGTWVATEAELNADGKFWWEDANDRIILYCTGGNPASYYGSVEIATLNGCIVAADKSYIVMQYLLQKYANTFGVKYDTCTNFIFQYLTAVYCGGGLGEERVGGGIVIVGDSNNATVQHCDVSQVLDYGIAAEIYDEASPETMYNIYIHNNTIDKCGAGAGLLAHKAIASELYNSEIKGNDITNTGYGWSGYAQNNVFGKGIAIIENHGTTKPDVHDILIENNTIDKFAWWGIAAFEGDFTIRNNVVKNGTADYTEGTNYPAGIALTGGDYVVGDSPGEATGIVCNNLIYANAGHGVLVKHNTPAAPENLLVYNNTLHGNGNATYRESLYSMTSSGTIFKNNTIHTEFDFMRAAPFGDGTTILDYNLYHKALGTKVWVWNGIEYNTLTAYQTASGQDANAVEGDPLFVSAGNGDFHLQASSSCIGAGVGPAVDSDVPTSDYDGLPREGDVCDIGAYNFAAGGRGGFALGLGLDLG